MNETSAGYAQDIKPLFRQQDRDAMKFAFDLWSYEDVMANADDILDRLTGGDMPCDGPWSGAQIAIFKSWIEGGKNP